MVVLPTILHEMHVGGYRLLILMGVGIQTIMLVEKCADRWK